MARGEREGAQPFHIGGIVPSLAVKADQAPVRSEVGIGALMPWADRLWMVTYLSNRKDAGGGTGLYEIDENLTMRKHSESVEGCYANRMMHGPTHQIIIGPHVIDADGAVRTMRDIQHWRLTATMEHLEDPHNKVYCLSMEGRFWEVDMGSLRANLLCDLVDELGISNEVMPHFKAGYTGDGKVVVANNTYDETEFLGEAANGRLAEWNGSRWTVLEKTAFNEVAGQKGANHAIFATGWDRASAILEVLVNGRWSKYRLPKASRNFDHYWQTEWPRIREVEHERLLMDSHGLFYELSPYAYAGTLWGIVPICRHLRVVPDFCSWQGFLVLGGDHSSPRFDKNLLAGEPQSGLWFGKIDDLWQFGKPQGWGGPWWETPVSADEPSAPYLMTGFEHKVVHFAHDAEHIVDFTIEVDFLGTQAWHTYETVSVPAHGYAHHEFPTGFSAHWVRVTASASCIASVQFMYT
jgi:hypothetical protein